MGLIKKQIWITGIRGRKRVKALFDSGAARNYIRGDLAQSIGFSTYYGRHNSILPNQFVEEGYRVEFKNMEIENRLYKNPEMIVMAVLSHEAIIGAYFMQKHKVVLNMAEDEIRIIQS